MILTCRCQVSSWASVFLCEVKTHSHTLEGSHCFAVGLNGSSRRDCVPNETEDVVYSTAETAEKEPKEEPLPSLHDLKDEGCVTTVAKSAWSSFGGGGGTKVKPCWLEGMQSVLLEPREVSALHRKARCTGLIAPPVAHFRPQLKPHHTPGGKEKEGLKYLRGLRVWSNDIRHGPIGEKPARNLQSLLTSPGEPQEAEPSVTSGLAANGEPGNVHRSGIWSKCFASRWVTPHGRAEGPIEQQFNEETKAAPPPGRELRLSRGHVGPLHTLKRTIANPHTHGANHVPQLVQGDVRKGLLRCKMV